jgi:CRP-like cAMP-binding protein
MAPYAYLVAVFRWRCIHQGMLTPAARTIALARGNTLFRQGSTTTAIFLVEAGCLRLERTTPDGRLLVLHTARAGAYFAEAALFSEVYHCDAVAVEPSRVRVHPKSEVLGLIRSDPGRLEAFLSLVARQLQEARQRLELRNIRSARERIMTYLALNAAPDGAVPVPRRLQDLAAELGLTREVLYRALASLEKEGAISRGGACLRLNRRNAPV